MTSSRVVPDGKPMSDFDELLAVLDLNAVASDLFTGSTQQKPAPDIWWPAHGAVIRREQPNANPPPPTAQRILGALHQRR